MATLADQVAVEKEKHDPVYDFVAEDGIETLHMVINSTR